MIEGEMKIALAKFKVGDGLDDKELNGLLKFFRAADTTLRTLTHQFDGGFGLARREVYSNLTRLESFKHAREGK